MSCVCILTPIVIAAWPAFSAAVVAATSSLGYTVLDEALQSRHSSSNINHHSHGVELSLNNSDILMEQIERDQKISIFKDGVTVTFSRDERGKAKLCVTGSGYSDDALRAIGEALSKRVVQKCVYQRLKDELKGQQFEVIEEETGSDQAIRLTRSVVGKILDVL
jgi:hypothetical protein